MGLVPSKCRLSHNVQLCTRELYQPTLLWLRDVSTLQPYMVLSAQVQHSRSVTHQDSSEIGDTRSQP